MENIKNKLELLYLEKNRIEEEIALLEQQLNNNTELISNKELSKEEKIELFKSLFIGRFDIFAKKWISKDGKKQNFYPVTQTFRGDDFLPLTNKDVEEHLRGLTHLATYCINQENRSKFLAFEILDSDKFKIQTLLNTLEIKAYYELNSFNSLIVWIFFEDEIDSNIVYNFAQYILSKANIHAKTYPNKEYANKSNLGSYLELPLQLKNRHQNKTVFIDVNTHKIYENQWDILRTINKLSKDIVYKYSQVSTIKSTENNLENIVFPQSINLVYEDYICIALNNLSKSLINKFKSFASFENPQVKVLLSLRKPLYNTPRTLRGYEEDKDYLKLPRGLFFKVCSFLNENVVSYKIEDKRVLHNIETKKVKFKLRPEQEDAILNIKKYDTSICVAPPGFGKTLIGAKMFEERSCRTLIIVNKNMLLSQWIDRFVDYFDYKKSDIGYLGKGKNKLNSNIDVATMQSLKNNPEVINNYSFLIIDECHHIPAVTFEQIIKNFKGKYLLGLSATPNRKDGLQPILYQQLGEISYEYKKKKTHYNKLKVVRTNFVSNLDNYAAIINELCVSQDRNNLIIDQLKEYRHRKILVLTDRIEHINILENLLDNEDIKYISIHGSMNKKDQVKNMSLVQDSSLILATTSYFGEGIDFPHLNTILFATPISYYGRLIQYLGRIGRGNQECLAIDFLDSRNAMLNSAYKKRLEGYKQMHYK